MEEKNKKKRTENWTQDDRNLLQQLVREKVNIVENKNTDTNTNNMKIKAWKSIEESFNLMANVKRNSNQIKQQWCIIKMNAKKQISAQRMELMKTGGGTSLLQKEPDSNDVRAWLPQEFVIDFNKFDSDQALIQDVGNAENVFNPLSSVNIEAEPITTMKENSQSMSGCVTLVNIEADHITTTGENTQSISGLITSEAKGSENRCRKRKNKDNMNESKITRESISAITDVEKKCRLELHQLQLEVEKKKLELYQLQIETERKKAENLDIERKFLLRKLDIFTKQNETL